MGAVRNSLLAAAAALGIAGGAVNVVSKWEGESKTTYKDSVGIKTICRGHTGPLALKGEATDAECDAAFLDDLAVARNTVLRCAPALPGSVESAFTSFTFNVGPGRKGGKDGFCVLKSGAEPGHLKYMKAGNFRAACAKLLEWNKAGGVALRGLTNRRVDELAVCLKDLK